MTTIDPPEIQKVTYNKDYSLDLTGFSNLELNFADDAAKSLFEKTLLCRIYGIEFKFTEDSSHNINGIEMTYYSGLKYKIMYAVGNAGGDTKKCLFGIVSDFEATGAKVDDPYSTADPKPKVDITSLNIKKPYFFIFAHKDGSTGANAVPAKDILRVHEIVTCPNTHFVSVYTKDISGTTTVMPNCGIFSGPDKEMSCVFGFFKTKEKEGDTDETQFFYLPTNSYCLQGRTKKIIETLDEGETLTGRFKVSTLYSNIVSS